MGLFVKGNNIKNVYVGNQKIKQIYKGIYPVWGTFDGVIYRYTGGFQTFTVPYGVEQINFAVAGVRGINGAGGEKNGAGGNGGLVKGKLNVTGGQTLYIWVGQYIASSSAVSGANYNASDIRTNNAGITDGTSLQSRLIVAGAGGNGGRTYNANIAGSGGAGGGLIGGNGIGDALGSGGTQTSGGSGGRGAQTTGYAGTFGLGGSGRGSGGIVPGAGGAGWYGGGGGGAKTHNTPYNVGGGGGGSSYTDASLCSDVIHTQGAITGEGYVKIWAIYQDEPGVEPEPPTPTEYESQFSGSWVAQPGEIGVGVDLTKDYGLDLLPSTTYRATIEQIGFTPTQEWAIISGGDASTYTAIPVASLVVGGTFTFTTAASNYNTLMFGTFGENVSGSIVLGIDRV